MSLTATSPLSSRSDAAHHAAPDGTIVQLEPVHAHGQVSVDSFAGAGQQGPRKLEGAVEHSRMNLIVVQLVCVARSAQFGQPLVAADPMAGTPKQSRPELQTGLAQGLDLPLCIAGLAGEAAAIGFHVPRSREPSRLALRAALRPAW